MRLLIKAATARRHSAGKNIVNVLILVSNALTFVNASNAKTENVMSTMKKINKINYKAEDNN